ncbi:hypothetical protein QBC40DRAFT_179899, partial [Triangularia verruculosa]
PVEAKAGPSAPQRIGTKNLFGEGGWLADTSSSAQQTPAQKKLTKATTPKAKSHFFGRMIDRARGRTHRSSMSQQQELTSPLQGQSNNSRLVISLTPREQSLIYCELDYVIAAALNDYIVSQLNCGRVDLTIMKKISDDWAKRGLAKVTGFRYDIETQLSILRAHIEVFKFYGNQATTLPAMFGVIDSMKNSAREMRVRTYCLPDVVIAKWM